MISFDSLRTELDDLTAQGLYRSPRKAEEICGGRIRVGSKWLVHLASNNYLGLTEHPRVKAAAAEAVTRFGTGAGSARLIGGNLPLHESLEEGLARFKQSEAALVFSTGYMANLGAVTALVGSGDLVIGDRFNHASLIDACRLSKATFRVFPHRDTACLAAALKRHRGQHRRALIVTEGVFSMDGDLAPLPEIVEAARQYDAWVLVDDAHGTGVLGEGGRGTVSHFGLSGILQMGTLSKALGSLGGYVAGPSAVIELLRNKARSFIYTTALPPASAAAAQEALRVIEAEPIWIERLWKNTEQMRAGLTALEIPLVAQESPILPVRVGDAQEAMRLAEELLAAGVYAPGIRPPTVPAGSACIRISMSAVHTPRDIAAALKAFQGVFVGEAHAVQQKVSQR